MACFAPRPVAHPFFRLPAHDFAPFLRLFDEAELQVVSPRRRHAPVFQPRFDVSEEKQAFHVQGELPGVEQNDIQIEFTDSNTILIKGRRVSERHSGNPARTPAEDVKGKGKAVENNTEAPAQTETDAQRASSPHQATVEDEDFVDVAETEGQKTPASQETQQAAQPSTPAVQPEAPKQPEPQQQSSKYLVRERSAGEFRRSFTFPGRVDQDAVRASLRNGILSVVVPKAEIPRRTINVE